MAMASVRDITIYDLRKGEGEYKMVRLTHVKHFQMFIEGIKQAFGIDLGERIMLCDTNRDAVCDDESLGKLEDGDTIYILRTRHQLLLTPTKQKIHYLPHYDTLVKSGMYEYYASEGQDPLPFAFAELIDNSLAATAEMSGSRNIELRLMLDDDDSKTAIVVRDNGQGMTPKQLNDWAIYRKSKFLRSDFTSRKESDLNVRRWLNSNMSYFGVGGKQGAFYIGNSIRVITKTTNKNDVHEFCMSEDKFKSKETSGEEIYCDYIHNRQLGDNNHVDADDKYVRQIIAEEVGRNSFTFVIIQGIKPDHVQYLKTNIDVLCNRLAHTYHYYIHGPNGNVDEVNSSHMFQGIEITVHLFQNMTPKKAINLRDVATDFQTLIIRSAAGSFEFKANVKGIGCVEGILRYHPYLYDKETYPSNHANEIDVGEDQDAELDTIRPARGKKPIFECYWNGRLIPYTTIEELDWCSAPKTSRNIPLECYNRLSGVLWTNDRFEVSTNKLTFMDLEVKLCEKSSIFSCVVNGQDKRGSIDKHFKDWLLKCHQEYDKQVKYLQFSGTVSRPELPKAKQHPWSVYKSAEWDGRVFKKGQMVRMFRVSPAQFGTITRFLVFGEQDSEGFAGNGFVEILREPQVLYNEVKIHPISKIDRSASKETILRWIDDELSKLPSVLILHWPEGGEIAPGQKLRAGQTIGPLTLEIANRKGELVTCMPGTNQRKLLIELKVIWHGSKGIDTIVCHMCEQSKSSKYHFKRTGRLTSIGPYSVQMDVITKGGDQSPKVGQVRELPSLRTDFVIIEGDVYQYSIGSIEGPLHIGLPFTIPLQFQDQYGHNTKPNDNLSPVIHSSGLQLSYGCLQVKDHCLFIKGVIAEGVVKERAGQIFTMVVTIPDMESPPQTSKIRILPGRPARMTVVPSDNMILENGMPVVFDVEVVDIAGNAATFDSNITVTCRFLSDSCNFPCYTSKCSVFGQACLTGPPIKIDAISGSKHIKAVIELKNNKDVPSVERMIKVVPSSRPSQLSLQYRASNGSYVYILPDQEIFYTAGEMIKGLVFTLLDESGNDVKMENNMISAFKVNWVPKLKSELILNMKLPDISVPFSVKESKYCNVLMGLDINFGFTVRPVPGEPVRMKADCVGSNKLRLDEPLDAGIMVSVTDKHGNTIEKFCTEIENIRLTGEGLRVNNYILNPVSDDQVLIKCVSFENGPLGPREVQVKWKKLTKCVNLEMVAGFPVSLSFPGFATAKIISVVNNHKLKTPLIAQLVDKLGNSCPDANMKIELNPKKGLKFSPALQIGLSDDNGRMVCGLPSISADCGNQQEDCLVNSCMKACLGLYSLETVVHLRRRTFGPTLLFHILPDPDKPCRIQVQCESTADCIAGETLAEYKVQIIAEDQRALQTVNVSQVTMNMWESGKASHKLVIPPTVDRKTVPGVFVFREQSVPETAGKHNIQFVYADGKHVINSDIISINVLAGKPVKLATQQTFVTPTVSNKHLQDRLLVRHLKLEMRDIYDNLAGEGLQGELLVQVMNVFSAREIPTLMGGVKSIHIPIVNGQVTLQNIMIEENSPGLDGQEYYLKCTVHSSGLPKSHTIPSYNIPFIFCNDAKKQQLMCSLTKERYSLLQAITTYKTLFHDTEKLHKTLQEQVNGVELEEQKVRLELNKYGIQGSSIMTMTHVKEALARKMFERDWNLKVPRRRCGLPSSPNDPQVVGKVGHLALIKDPDIARVVSWHMSGDMDCIVTHTLRKADEIFRRTRGMQQVISLDSLYNKKHLTDRWNKRLPHTKIPGRYQPTGNPVYARDLLIFPTEVLDECKLIFGLFLGETIIMDTLEDGNQYRKEVVKYTFCPTILTRNGERIQGSGKFGGKSNLAPSLSDLRDAVFGEPDDRNNLNTAIELLQELCAILDRLTESKEMLKTCEFESKSLATQERRRDCEAKEAELKEIEKQLGACSSQHATRSSSVLSQSEESLSRNKNSPIIEDEDDDEESNHVNNSQAQSQNEERLSRSRRQSGWFQYGERDTGSSPNGSHHSTNSATLPLHSCTNEMLASFAGRSLRDRTNPNLLVLTTAPAQRTRTSSRNTSRAKEKEVRSRSWDDSQHRKRPRT